jgi:hypothetical protein
VWYTASLVQTGHAVELGLGDVVRLRKPHPCGSRDWQVVRLGADIGLSCQGCGHRVVLSRQNLARRLTALTRSGGEGPAASR